MRQVSQYAAPNWEMPADENGEYVLLLANRPAAQNKYQLLSAVHLAAIAPP
jgi:hypothetical protein